MSNLVGKILSNRYHVQEFLGRGGMAEVYKVWDSERAVVLAMKVLHQDLAEDRVFLRRFKREAENLSKLAHPHIVRFYGLVQDGRLSFILMDYIEGLTLRTEIFDHGAGLPFNRVRQIIQSVSSALHYAHSSGLVHCDIKPANIMIKTNGDLLLSDFGISRMTDAATSTMVGVGTPAYMAPEQIRGQDPTAQSDIYSLGIVLFEMLTGGERPFTGESATTTGSTSELVRWEQINMPPPSPRKYNAEITKELEDVVFRCLEKDPSDRYQTSLDLMNALEGALGLVEEGDAVPLSDKVDGANSIPQEGAGKSEKTKGKGVKPGAQKVGNKKGWLVGIGVVIVGLVWIIMMNSGNGGEPFTNLSNNPPILQDSSISSPISSGTGKIAFQSNRDGNTKIYLMNIDGSNVKSLNIDDDYNDYYPSWSLDGSKIAFGSSLNGNSIIFFMDADGSNVKSLMINDGTVDNLAWSPDGSKVVGEIFGGGNSKIYIFDADGNNPTSLSNKGATDYSPVWSPDGGMIAFETARDGNREIYLMDVNGSNIIRLTDSEGDDYFPAWAPDGSKVLFLSKRDGNDEIYVRDADGTHTRLTNNESIDTSPAWSPDGSKIAFTSYRDGNYEIYVMDFDGSNIQRLTNNDASDSSPGWSPKGNRIVFESDRDGNYEIYVMNADGSDLIRLTNNDYHDFGPVWQP